MAFSLSMILTGVGWSPSCIFTNVSPSLVHVAHNVFFFSLALASAKISPCEGVRCSFMYTTESSCFSFFFSLMISIFFLWVVRVSRISGFRSLFPVLFLNFDTLSTSIGCRFILSFSLHNFIKDCSRSSSFCRSSPLTMSDFFRVCCFRYSTSDSSFSILSFWFLITFISPAIFAVFSDIWGPSISFICFVVSSSFRASLKNFVNVAESIGFSIDSSVLELVPGNRDFLDKVVREVVGVSALFLMDLDGVFWLFDLFCWVSFRGDTISRNLFIDICELTSLDFLGFGVV